MVSELRLESETVIPAADLADRVKELGSYYSKLFGAEELIVITLMRGAMFFSTDLCRAIKNPNIIIDDLRPRSYLGTKSVGDVKVDGSLDIDIAGKNVLIIDDILDTGKTLTEMTKRIRALKPKKLAVACMFEKPSGRLHSSSLDCDDLQIGIRIADVFVIGYGLDWNGRYRALPYVTIAVESKSNLGFYEPVTASAD